MNGRRTSLAVADPGVSKATSRTPAARVTERLCMVVDEVATSRSQLSGELLQLGVDVIALRNSYELADALGDRAPRLIFVNTSGSPADALGSMLTLKQVSYPGKVQLIGADAPGALNHFIALGEQFDLTMLPFLHKPVPLSAVQTLVRLNHLSGPPIKPPQVSLQEALDSDWVEFWYQPKIDFTTRKAAGAESFARVNHPRHGVVGPQAFMQDADDKALGALAERAIVNALKIGARFDQLGIVVRIAVNVSVEALTKLRVLDLVKQHRPTSTRWAGLIFDLGEQNLYRDGAKLKSIIGDYDKSGVKFALDDFGRGDCSLTSLKDISFTEIKIDRSFTRDCAADVGNRNICKTIIDLAHNFGAQAVAVGVENRADAHALRQMGCDMGQGFYFSGPLPEADFVALLRGKA